MPPTWRNSYETLVLAAVLVLGACSTSPPSRYYTLTGAGAAATPAAASGPSVMVGPVAIPAVVDRPEIVITVGENEVWLDEFNRWASPLSDAVAIAVAENLGATLATPRVTLLSQSSGGQADYRVAVEVQRFDSVPGSYALLDAVYSVRRADGRAATGRTTSREPVADKSYDTLAAAHSRAVARLSRDIAESVRSLAAVPAR